MQMWKPSPRRIKQANVTKFISQVESQRGMKFADFHAFYQWTIDEPQGFWAAVWEFFGIIASQTYSDVLRDGDKMPGARWFLDNRLNFAENLLRYRDDQTALVFWGEDRVRREMTYAELFAAVARLVEFLRELGVGRGDRVAGFIPNIPEAVIAMLATTSLGAIWSSCSPDFGVEGVVDRFGQIEPKVLFTADGYYYKGRTFDSLEKVDEIVRSIPSIQKVVVANYVGVDADTTLASRSADKFVSLTHILDSSKAQTIEFEQVPFDHPLYIMYSSGTTGKPKCIVHGAGGTLITHLKEHRLHTDLKRPDKLFYATTCGWMMWNWLVSSLATGVTVVLYDGVPTLRDNQILFDMADAEQVTVFGTSAGFLSAVQKAGLRPAETHQLTSLKTILSTGSPLGPESFDYVYQHIKQDLCLSSISGGTDIIGCFALGCPAIPVYRGQLQTRSLGCAVEVFGEDGQSLSGEKGELVCTASFPSMPVGFWNDPDGQKYHDAYFSRYEQVWHHGDYVMLTEENGMIFYGRSDATLNPGGVRIGTAEVYRQIETFEQIESSVVIGQQWESGTRIVLFVKLKPGVVLDQILREQIKQNIRSGASPRHVPSRIVEVEDIPVTRSGKISELAVSNVVHHRTLQNVEALANPESLDCFRDLEVLRR